MPTRTLLLLGLIFFSFSACVTASDLQRRDEALLEWRTDAEIRLQRLQDGTLSREEYDRQSRESRRELQDELGAVVKDVQERTERVVGTLSSPITGNPLVDLIGTVLVGAAGTYVATNKARDRRRALRGEPVVPVPPR